MSGMVQRRCRKKHESIFYRDLRTTKCWANSSSPSAWPWPHGFGGQDPRPPPLLSLDDLVEYCPDDDRFRNPTKTNFAPVSSNVQGQPIPSSTTHTSGFRIPGASNWLDRSGDVDGQKERAGDTRVLDAGQKQSRGLPVPPYPWTTVRPEIQGNDASDAHEWVTVYGFKPQDTNLVLQEFEKCGTILKHVPGPSSANWVHILYKNFYDAQKALQKNGMQINAVLIVGVKPLDPLQCQALTEKINTAFMTLPARSSGGVTKSSSSVKASSRPYYLQQPNGGCQRSGPMALPSKSTISRIADLIFGT